MSQRHTVYLVAAIISKIRVERLLFLNGGFRNRNGDYLVVEIGYRYHLAFDFAFGCFIIYIKHPAIFTDFTL